jgi:Arc/MetJ-type ribon-helix-helix transcriptional regulator
MVITGGSSARYYRCGDTKKRGTCSNKLSVKEEIARTCIFNAIRSHFSSVEAVDFVRHEIADELGKMNRELAPALKHHGELLARTETRIGGLIEFISHGDQSDYIRQTLVDLEAQAMVEKNAIEALKRQAAKPIQLPSPDELMEVAYNLEQLAVADPALGREELRKIFDQGHIVLLPQPDGYYLAKSRIFPLVPLLHPRYTNAPSGEDGALSSAWLRGGARRVGQRGKWLILRSWPGQIRRPVTTESISRGTDPPSVPRTAQLPSTFAAVRWPIPSGSPRPPGSPRRDEAGCQPEQIEETPDEPPTNGRSPE